MKLVEKNKVTTRAAAIAVPLHLCFETFDDITESKDSSWLDKTSLEVGEVLLVKDAP